MANVVKETKEEGFKIKSYHLVPHPRSRMAQNKFIFDRANETNLSHFLFYLENVVERALVGGKKARVMISYLYRGAFKQYYNLLTEDSVLEGDANSFVVQLNTTFTDRLYMSHRAHGTVN